MPFAKITHNKRGEKLKDTSRAHQLTAFLHAHAGLAFQLFCAATDLTSPLFQYEEQLVNESSTRSKRWSATI